MKVKNQGEARVADATGSWKNAALNDKNNNLNPSKLNQFRLKL